MHQHNAAIVADYCRAHLDFSNLTFGYYQHLPLCVIDAVFSINANYTSTRNAVERSAVFFGLDARLVEVVPPMARQAPLSVLIAAYEQLGVDAFANQVYQNKQRTSTTNGILKADSVLRFAQVLQRHGVTYMQDVDNVIGHAGFEQEIKQIPGQSSGLCLRYFYILTGSPDHVKPDRMILRFIQAALGRAMDPDEAHSCIVAACAILRRDFPGLTPAILDNQIWRYQRQQP